MQGFRIVILGAGGTGKSALAIRFALNEFVNTYDPTIEDLFHKPMDVDGEISMVEVVDTAGFGQFPVLESSYVQESHGFIVAFSLTDVTSLEDAETLLENIYHSWNNVADIPVVLVGTKLDLQEERDIQEQALTTLRTRWGVPIYETSALHRTHIDDPFAHLVRQLRRQTVVTPSQAHQHSCVVM